MVGYIFIYGDTTIKAHIESEVERKVLGYLNEHGLDPKQFDTAPNFEGTGISTDKEGRQVNNLTLLKKK